MGHFIKRLVPVADDGPKFVVSIVMRSTSTLTAGILGTSAMTASSYLVSYAKDNNFKEPEILGKLIRRLHRSMGNGASLWAGWGLHYLVGLLFAEMYTPLWQKDILQPTEKNGLVLGGISGLAAILIWKFTLEVHPDPPKLKFRKYAGHLFVAHLIFGLFATLGYKIASSCVTNMASRREM